MNTDASSMRNTTTKMSFILISLDSFYTGVSSFRIGAQTEYHL